MTIRVLDDSQCPPWFTYPRAYLRLVEQGIVDLTPWYLLDAERVTRYAAELVRRYPGTERLPFARRQDNDDVACFDRSRPGQVVLLHDGATPGTEQRRVFPDVWAWFRFAVEQMIEWEP